MNTTIHLISTSLRPASTSRKLIETIEAALVDLGARVTVTDLRNLPPVFCDGGELCEYPPEYQQLAADLRAADGTVLAVPVHLYGPSGASKVLMDVVGDALADAPVGVVTAAGSSRSHLAAVPLITSLMFDCQSFVFPLTVQAIDGESDMEEITMRVKSFAVGFLAFVRRLRAEAA